MPGSKALSAAREEAAHCTMCHLYKHATQTVFGEGAAHAELMLVGEQPGDKEDLSGKPFVGPAGVILNKALAEAGIDRSKTFVTNAVKHFKFTPRGKIRLHQKPTTAEIRACNPWLQRERAIVKPKLVIAMGATAGDAYRQEPRACSCARRRIVRADHGASVLSLAGA